MIIELRRTDTGLRGSCLAEDGPADERLVSLLLCAYRARMQALWHGALGKKARSQTTKSQPVDLMTEVTKVLRQGADPNKARLPIKGFTHTPLTLAVHIGNPALVQTLLSAGASPFSPDPSGKTAVEHAISTYGTLGAEDVSRDVLQGLLMAGSTDCDCVVLLAGLRAAADTGAAGLSGTLTVIFHWGLGIHKNIAAMSRLHDGTDPPQDRSSSQALESAADVLASCLLHGGDLTFAKQFFSSLWFSLPRLQTILTKVAQKSKYFRTVLHHFGTKSNQGFLHKVHKSLDKCCGKNIVDAEQYSEILQDYQDFLGWLDEEVTEPPTLMRQARRSVLAALQGRLIPCIPHLELPRPLEKYLIFDDLQYL